MHWTFQVMSQLLAGICISIVSWFVFISQSAIAIVECNLLAVCFVSASRVTTPRINFVITVQCSTHKQQPNTTAVTVAVVFVAGLCGNISGTIRARLQQCEV